MHEQVEQVNRLLQAGEPGNVTKPDNSDHCGYAPQAIIDAMNEVFGLGNWGFEEISSEMIESGDKGLLAICNLSCWLKDIAFHPTSWGQARVTRGDLGDARKGAQTDAIKKALSYFSIGARAYHGLLNANGKSGNTQLDDSPPSQSQLDSIKKLCADLDKQVKRPATYLEAKALIVELLKERGIVEPKKAS